MNVEEASAAKAEKRRQLASVMANKKLSGKEKFDKVGEILHGKVKQQGMEL